MNRRSFLRNLLFGAAYATLQAEVLVRGPKAIPAPEPATPRSGWTKQFSFNRQEVEQALRANNWDTLRARHAPPGYDITVDTLTYIRSHVEKQNYFTPVIMGDVAWAKNIVTG